MYQAMNCVSYLIAITAYCSTITGAHSNSDNVLYQCRFNLVLYLDRTVPYRWSSPPSPSDKFPKLAFDMELQWMKWPKFNIYNADNYRYLARLRYKYLKRLFSASIKLYSINLWYKILLLSLHRLLVGTMVTLFRRNWIPTYRNGCKALSSYLFRKDGVGHRPMLDFDYYRNNAHIIRENIKNRDCDADIDQVVSTDLNWSNHVCLLYAIWFCTS